MTQVQVGLVTILGNEDLTMLERVHGARVDVDVRVELLLQHMDAAAAQQTTELGGGQAFSEG